jgi:hypothetical protein
MVMKEQKSESGGYKEVFSAFKRSITKTVGVAPIEKTVEYEDLLMRVNNTYAPALVGVWKLKTRKIFLMVRYDSFSSGNPIMLYMDTQGWAKYINATKQYELHKKQEVEKNNKAEF